MHPSDSNHNGDSNAPANASQSSQPPNPATAIPDAAAVEPELAETAVDTEDRRSSPRRKKLLRILVRNDAISREPFSGWILDRSMGGMCLSLDHEVEPGTILAVSRVPQTVASRWVELRVLNVRERESTWEIGCEYTRVPSWEVMLQFE
jgi:hypothetical protein